MNLDFTPESWAEYVDWLGIDKKITKRINMLFKDMLRDPFDGLGKPEPLQGEWAGFWSRRIDGKNRIVYRVHEGRLQIVQCKGHYGDH